MTYLRNLLLPSVMLLVFCTSLSAQKYEKQFDQLLNNEFPAEGPGATALVAVNGEIIYHRAFGMANMELNVKNRPEMVFEIGSITKQFTAVSILMLMEQGKLNLDDDITKYIPDYPTHGHTISIHHLLTHTSGIKSYTSMEKWRNEWRKDFTPIELIDFFDNEPMDFAPGEEWLYNNSAYFILGYIIEIASGQTYEEFLEKNIFKPLSMSSSYYGSQSEIIPNRASGYQRDGETIINAEYLSLTQPYAAGSIMSTVSDLFIWNRAIRLNKLISKESKELAFTNYTLNNGENINYGYGWVINEIKGSPTIEHGGGIFGYQTNSIYLPEEDVFVAVFANSDFHDPSTVSTRMAAIAINKPYPSPKDYITVKPEKLEKLVGVYEFEDSATRIITLDSNQLYSQRTGSTKFKIHPVKGGIFWYENSLANIQFIEKDDQIEAVFTYRRDKTKGVKTDKPIPTHTEVNVSDNILQNYVGVYVLAPNFDITITLEDGKLMSQATGQEKFQLFAESEIKFFLKVVDAQIEFIKNEEGQFDSFVLYQGGQEIPGKKKN